MSAYDVFISYKSEDFSEANWIRNILETNNISCWMAPTSITGGSNYAQAIPTAISNSKIFLLLISSRTQQSTWISKEINQAVSCKKIIMPYMIEDCELYNEFNFYLNDVQRYDAFKSKSEVIRKMIVEMRAIIGNTQSTEDVRLPNMNSETVSSSFESDKDASSSQLKCKAENKKTSLWTWLLIAFTYFWCIPAGAIVMLAQLILSPRIKNAALFNRVIQYLCIAGSLVGAVIFLYAITHYDHCDEAMFFSIIGLLSELLRNSFV